DGIELHFIHEQGEGNAPLPLLLTHGWPGSIVEFHELIPLLTHPSASGGDARDAFTVVAPSMPGYGFSFRANQRRFDLREIADTFSRLMTDVLGFRTFGAHGHDWDAFVATRLGYAYKISPAFTSPCWRFRASGCQGASPATRKRASTASSITGSKRSAAIRGSWARSRKRLPTRCPTHRSGSPPGSWKNSVPGATARATSTRIFRATCCSPTSCCIG